MALKSVVDIQVNDGSFQTFAANFKKYQEASAKQPGEWEAVKKSIDGSAKSFQALVTASIARQANARAVAAAETEASRQLDRQTFAWRDMARSTKSVATNILSMTTSLLKWGTLIGAFSGLLGVGGLFGLERLAQSASAQRRSSLGLGITPGEQRSFGINYGRVVDAESVLSATNAALIDPAQRVNLYNAGLTENDIRGKDAAQVSASLIDSLKRLADQTDPKMLGGVYSSRNLGALGISLEDFKRIGATSAGELGQYRRQFQGDTASLDLKPGQLSAWQEFNRQLELSGSQIKTTLIDGLTGLTEPLSKLSKSFSGLVCSALLSPTGRQWIDDIAGALERFAKFVGTKEFKDDVEGFVTGIGKMARALGRFVSYVGGGDAASPDRSGDTDAMRFRSYGQNAETKSQNDAIANREKLDAATSSALKGFWEWLKSLKVNGGEGFSQFNPTGMPQGNLSGNASIAHDFFRSHGWSEAQTAGLLANAQAESGFDPSRVNQTGGDAGLFQWRGDRARQFAAMFGHSVQQGSLDEQLRYAQWELTEGPEKAHGAYLRGIRDAATAGDYVTRAYERPDPNRIDTIAAQRAFGAVRIYIENNTGGNAIVTASQLAT